MNFGNEVRVHVGDRPHYPEDTTYQAEVVYGSSLLRAGGLPSCLVRAYPPGSDPNVPGEQVGSRFETFDQRGIPGLAVGRGVELQSPRWSGLEPFCGRAARSASKH